MHHLNNPHRGLPSPSGFNKICTAAAGALAICAITGALGPTIDSLDEIRATQDSLTDAQRQARAEFARDLAAAKLCREQYGEASFSWAAAGELVCTPHRSKTVSAL